MSTQKLINITSASKEITKAKQTGILDMSVIFLYQMYQYYLEFTEDKEIFETENVQLWDRIAEVERSYPKQICNFKTVLSSSVSAFTDETIEGSGSTQAPIVTSFTATVFSQDTLFGSGALFSTHTFTQAEFSAVYSDKDEDTAFHSLILHRDSLEGGSLKFNETATTGQIYGESTSTITIPYADVPKWSFYTNSTSEYTHTLGFQLVDDQGGVLVESNLATMTLDRTAEGNQPATIGDSAIMANNRVTTIITTAMVTSSLSPPYNDPEGDLIDALRIDEISTANSGVFQYNGVDVTTGQIITKADLDANLFTHDGADSNDIETDAINFSVRDAGSLIWVN